VNLGAALGFYLDARERRTFLARLMTPEVGFHVVDGDAAGWLWRFGLEAMTDELSPPCGPAVQLCALLGVPCARLRAALPDELLRGWDMGTVLGRRHAFSKGGIDSALAMQKRLVPRLSFSTRGGNKAATASEEVRMSTLQADVDAPSSSSEDLLMETFVGTAMVLAFMQIAALVPVAQLALHKSAAKRHFDAVLTPAGYDFQKTFTDFLTLLSPGILNIGRRWLPRARMWKLILSQSPEGWWDASSTSAFALEARALSETEQLPPTLLSRVTDLLSRAAEEAAERGTGGGGVGDALQGRGGRDDATDDVLEAAAAPGNVQNETHSEPARVAADMKPVGNTTVDQVAAEGAADQLFDCPLSCYPDAIAASMPRRLARLGVEEPNINVVRVWTTFCCIAVLERLNVSWFFGDGDLYPETERTIVDGAREWVERYADANPKLAKALADGALKRTARKLTVQWRRANEARVSELRRSKAIRKYMAHGHVHRTAASIVRAFVSKHSTFATFLSEPLDGLQRWQSACLWRIASCRFGWVLPSPNHPRAG
jgi:hypothetical protein